MRKEKFIEVVCGPDKKIIPGVKEQLVIHCGPCALDWTAQEIINDKSQHVLSYHLQCPNCGKVDDVVVATNLDDFSPDAFFFYALEIEFENPKAILVTATALEYIQKNAIVGLQINLLKDEIFVRLPEC